MQGTGTRTALHLEREQNNTRRKGRGVPERTPRSAHPRRPSGRRTPPSPSPRTWWPGRPAPGLRQEGKIARDACSAAGSQARSKSKTYNTESCLNENYAGLMMYRQTNLNKPTLLFALPSSGLVLEGLLDMRQERHDAVRSAAVLVRVREGRVRGLVLRHFEHRLLILEQREVVLAVRRPRRALSKIGPRCRRQKGAASNQVITPCRLSHPLPHRLRVLAVRTWPRWHPREGRWP